MALCAPWAEVIPISPVRMCVYECMYVCVRECVCVRVSVCA